MKQAIVLVALAALVVAAPVAAALPELPPDPEDYEPTWYCGGPSVDVWVNGQFVACVRLP